jgi:hypothetical protein
MAAGNQAEKGIWALLVIAARTITAILRERAQGVDSRAWSLKFHLAELRTRPRVTKMATSPTRLERAVISPAL